MKKLLLTLSVLTAAVTTAAAQVEIGLKVSPSITYLRADGPSKNPFQSESAQLGFGGGLVVDYFFGENYAFSTGLQLTGKGGSYSYKYPSPLSPNDQLQGGTYKLSTQYLEVPASVKLFTNEITTDVRLYFQVGASVAVPIGARINGEKNFIDPNTGQESTALKHVFFIDANALAGIGAEYQLAKSTKVFGGFSYHRGLIDLDHYFESERSFDDVTIKNNVVALDLGIKF
jgi:hypothetical protein